MKIGNAKISETSSINGKKGDQTKGEVAIQDYYVHSKGWYFLKPKSEEVADKMVRCMIAACNNDHIGYGQNDRLTSYNEAKKVNFDCSKIKEDCNTDCSELIRICCAYAGIMVNDFYTGNEKSVLMATGQFEEVSGPCYGCVLVTKSKGHTALVIDGKEQSSKQPAKEPVKTVQSIAKGGKEYEALAYVTRKEETKVEGKVVPLNDLNVRETPAFDIRDTWYKIQNGYISAYRVTGWVKDDKGWWFERENHNYPRSEVANCDGKEYAFDKNGYMLTSNRIAEDGHIVY